MSMAPENNFSREELTLRLEKVAKRNRSAVNLFAARCVMRALPLLTQAPLFDYWIIEGEDKRAHYLLALWRGILSAWINDTATAAANAELAEEAALAVGRSNWKLSAHIAEAASYVNASVHMSVAAAGYAVHFARLAISNAAQTEGFNRTQPTNFDVAIDNDLRFIEKENDIVELPLWSDVWGSDNSIDPLQHWIKVIFELELHDNSINPDRAKLVSNIVYAYQQMHYGKYSEPEAKEFLTLINLYFSQSEINSPDEEKKSTTEKTDFSTTPETLFKFTASRQQAAEAISEEDHLNRKKLVETLASFLAHPSNYHHQTIGLLGDWGVGKSSFIHLLKESILKNHADQPFLFGEFNAWAYENTDNLQAGIAQEIIKALSSPESKLEDFKRKPKQPKTLATAIQTEWSNFKKALSWSVERSLLVIRFAITLNGPKILWLLLLIFIATSPWNPLFINFFNHLLTKITASNDLDPLIATGGRILWAGGFLFYLGKELQKLLANPMAKELLTYIRLPDYAKHLGTIPQMRKNIETLCRVRLQTDSEKSKRLLFVVDDLDRCGHQAIVKVLEAVRLVLDIQNVMVVIAVDQRIALSALALHYKDFAQYHNSKDSRSIARDYLAKVIHLPITLYKPKGEDIKAYLNFIWSQMVTEEHKTILKKATPPPIGETVSDKTQPPENNSEQTLTDQAKTQPLMHDEKILPTEVQHTTKPATTKTTGPKESPTNEQAEPTIIASLSEDHQRAFLYWVDYFELSNPRQVKRLNNSYNLLHSYYDYDSVAINHGLKETHKEAIVFPMMLALFIMEYLNTLDDQLLRIKIKTELRNLIPKTKVVDKNMDITIASTLISADIFLVVHHLTETLQTDLIKIVEPFVLPAIECH